eukprot:Awhi_evm1s12103
MKLTNCLFSEAFRIDDSSHPTPSPGASETAFLPFAYNFFFGRSICRNYSWDLMTKKEMEFSRYSGFLPSFFELYAQDKRGKRWIGGSELVA